MSVRIFCDRCGEDTHQFFLDAVVEVKRGNLGVFVESKVVSDQHNFVRRLQICEPCSGELRRFLSKPRVGPSARVPT